MNEDSMPRLGMLALAAPTFTRGRYERYLDDMTPAAVRCTSCDALPDNACISHATGQPIGSHRPRAQPYYHAGRWWSMRYWREKLRRALITNPEYFD